MARRAGTTDTSEIIPIERIERQIVVLRRHKVMLDVDLAEAYGVAVGRLNEAVKRNRERFPPDFMFQLTVAEFAALRSQFATSNAGRGGRRYRPYAFIEHGAVMVASILNSPTAVRPSIAVVRAFVRLRQFLADSDVLRRKLDEIEAKLTDHDEKLAVAFQAIRQLMDDDAKRGKRPRIGYETEHGGGKRVK